MSECKSRLRLDRSPNANVGAADRCLPRCQIEPCGPSRTEGSRNVARQGILRSSGRNLRARCSGQRSSAGTREIGIGARYVVEPSPARSSGGSCPGSTCCPTRIAPLGCETNIGMTQLARRRIRSRAIWAFRCGSNYLALDVGPTDSAWPVWSLIDQLSPAKIVDASSERWPILSKGWPKRLSAWPQIQLRAAKGATAVDGPLPEGAIHQRTSP